MKDIRASVIELLKEGNCTPRISRLAVKLHSHATTVHYNIKQLEKNGTVIAYKAVFDYKKIGEGFCSYVLINLTSDEYGDPERIARELARHPSVESVDIITGEWEMLVKVRSQSIEQYYELARTLLSIKGIGRTHTLNSLKQLKTEFVATK